MIQKNTFKKWLKDEDGQALSEYGLLIALVAIGATVAIVTFRKELVSKFDSFAKCLGYTGDTVSTLCK